MISLGPCPIPVVIIAVAALTAWLLCQAAARSLDKPATAAASSIIFNALFVSVVIARISYVITWWPEYRVAPFSIIAISDGGFTAWAGIIAAFIYLSWKTYAHQWLRRPVLAGAFAGLFIWLSANGMLAIYQYQSPPLPNIPLTTVTGEPAPLHSYLGRPLVVNLWATWCPPCQREMPAFARTEAMFPTVAFLMINQGEGNLAVDDFMKRIELSFTHLLLDPNSRVMEAFGARAFPTTLFFNAEGELVDIHMGELTTASLTDKIQRRFNIKPTRLSL